MADGVRQVPPLLLDINARLEAIDHLGLRRYRLARLRSELARRDVGAALLMDALNILYATGTRNMPIFTLHAPARYALVFTEGPVILFESHESAHVTAGIETVDEVRHSTPWFYFAAGPRVSEKLDLWSAEIVSLMREYAPHNGRLAVDRCEPWGAARLEREGLELVDAQEIVEHAHSTKSTDELDCIQLAVDVADIGIAAMREAAEPGVTENQLWSLLHSANIAHGGEWIECRLLSSGERTNPWFQEAGNRRIEAGDMIAFDTNLVGPTGYLADFSRSFVCPGASASGEQRTLYGLAQEQVLHNIDLLAPGVSFREVSDRAWKVPERYLQNRYGMLVHGTGFVDEYPSIAFPQDWDTWGYDGILEANMVVSVESYIGEVGGKEGVKLEEQVVITDKGAQPLSRSPLLDALET
jgi:Xaa-Pro aminopeptidase